MKTKRAIEVAVLMALAVTAAYWLGYHHGSNPQRNRINSVSSLRQIGLAPRHFHNDFGALFTITGPVATPNAQTQQP